VRLLLDTHILLWALADPLSLSERARDAVTDAANDVYVSSLSLWEIAIKARLGKLSADVQEVHAAALVTGFRPLPFTLEHAIAIAGLPEHHRDPFDRGLIAQAQVEPLFLLTHDGVLAAYGADILVV
jgi:PIN domain nuclease of toxin-antitoxin system